MAGTRSRSIRVQETDSFPKIIHDIDQFSWYRDIKRRTSSMENEEESLSSVRFDLPHVYGEINPYLIIVGNGFNLCEVYMARINWGLGLLNRDISSEEDSLWKIFSYFDSKNFRKDEEIESLIKKIPLKLGKIFGTDIAPFLRGGNYPSECDRVYNFGLDGSDQFRVIARNRKNRDDESLEITWIPDSRDGHEKKLLTLKDKWVNYNDLDLLPFTQRFTFPSPSNGDYL